MKTIYTVKVLLNIYHWQDESAIGRIMSELRNCGSGVAL